MVDSFDPGSGCAARSMIVAAGRWECGNLLVLEISSISTAAFGLGAILIAQALHLQGVAVEARQRKGSEVHAIVTIVDRQQRDALSIQHLAEKHIPLLPVNHPSLPHAAHHAGAAIVRFRYPCGILSRRRAVARLRGLHVQAGGPAFRWQTAQGGAPSFAAFSRRVGGRVIPPWALPFTPHVPETKSPPALIHPPRPGLVQQIEKR